MNTDVIMAATLSEDFRYLYDLSRCWTSEQDAPFVLWLMLNPSTADAHKDDATIRKCIGFTRLWGKERLVVVNLFACRTTFPGELLSARDPVGSKNDYHISLWSHLTSCRLIVCAWGSLEFLPKQNPLRSRIAKVLDLIGTSKPLICLGTSKSGDPRHPSRIGYANPTQPFTILQRDQRSSAAKKGGSL